jgi:hypothetical protein
MKNGAPSRSCWTIDHTPEKSVGARDCAYTGANDQHAKTSTADLMLRMFAPFFGKNQRIQQWRCDTARTALSFRVRLCRMAS